MVSPSTSPDVPLRLELSRNLAQIPKFSPASEPVAPGPTASSPVQVTAPATVTATTSPSAPVKPLVAQPVSKPETPSLLGAFDASWVVPAAGLAVVGVLVYWLNRRRSAEVFIPPSESVLWAAMPTVIGDATQAPAVGTPPPASRKSGDTIPLPDAPEVAPVSEVSSQLPSDFSTSRPAKQWPQATLSDLQGLVSQLKALLRMRDDEGANKLLTRHIQTHARTSPWVFYELFQVLTRLNQPKQWEGMKAVYRIQFGQPAPDWGKPLPSQAFDTDPLLVEELTRLWPSSSTKLWIDRWMLGTGSPLGSGPPALSLEIYREFLWLDKFLTELLQEFNQKRRQKQKEHDAANEPEPSVPAQLVTGENS